MASFSVPSESALAQPPFSFSKYLSWCRFRFGFLHCKITAALIQGRGRPSGNVRGAKPYVLAPPTLCAHIPPAKGRRSRGRGSLKNLITQVLYIFSNSQIIINLHRVLYFEKHFLINKFFHISIVKLADIFYLIQNDFFFFPIFNF